MNDQINKKRRLILKAVAVTPLILATEESKSFVFAAIPGLIIRIVGRKLLKNVFRKGTRKLLTAMPKVKIRAADTKIKSNAYEKKHKNKKNTIDYIDKVDKFLDVLDIAETVTSWGQSRDNVTSVILSNPTSDDIKTDSFYLDALDDDRKSQAKVSLPKIIIPKHSTVVYEVEYEFLPYGKHTLKLGYGTASSLLKDIIVRDNASLGLERKKMRKKISTSEEKFRGGTASKLLEELLNEN